MNETPGGNKNGRPSACRDCFGAWRGAAGARCPLCRSERTVSHQHLPQLAIAHIDCDAFYASIEKRDQPDLLNQPVIVGGGRRGVVATCCYIARTYGVKSAMPMFRALSLCPNAVVIRPRMDVYLREARRIRELMQSLTPLVEPVSIDEAYLDLSGTEALHGAPPAISLMKLQRDIETELGLGISVGLASNKFLAKLASEADKPRGFFALCLDEAPEWLAGRPVRVISGVGAHFEKRLNADGLRTVRDIQETGIRALIQRYGETGQWLHNSAFGRHDGRVRPAGERKSISSEMTFSENISDRQTLEDYLWLLCEQTAGRAKRAGVEGGTVTLKMKSHDFRTLSRRTALVQPTQLAQTIFRAAVALLARESGVRSFRLLGVGVSDLHNAGGDTLDLGDPTSLKRAKAERAADIARERFGGDIIGTGRGARIGKRSKT